MSWELSHLLRATGAELVQWGPGPFTGISTDSRRTAPGEVFLALRGPNFDGHDFLSTALGAGAHGAIVGPRLVPEARDVAWMRVEDTLQALGDLAAMRRRELPVHVVAVTGSNGKTTTKEMIASVLASGPANVARSRGTENNLVGLPQTILRLRGDEDFAVLEMGMNHPGEIWRLTEIARPDVGVITNVGPAHLEGLGSLSNVAAAKAELVLAMSSQATLVVNTADPRLKSIAEMFPGKTVSCGEGGAVRLQSVEPLGNGAQRIGLEIAGREIPVELRCVGAHNVANALLAATVGHVLGLAADAIAAGLESFRPPPMRLETIVLPNGARILNDAYNANPASMVAALSTLSVEPARRRIAVLGEMWELGSAAAEYHREVGRAVGEKGIDLLIAVGRYAAEMAAGAAEAGLDASGIRSCESVEQAAQVLRSELADRDVVLVKASRAARLEDLIRRVER